MKNSVSSRKELTILKLEEEVFDFRHSACFRQTIENLLQQENSRNLIIDFTQVKAIDSSGISAMLLAHQLSNQCRGLAIFVSLCQQIKDILKLTNLDKQLYIFSSINEVMTLIEPAMKNKRGGRGKATAEITDETADEICDEILVIDETIIHDLSLDEEMTDENPEIETDPETSSSDKNGGLQKKRGRPKKNSK
ncbi:MAG: STAS domain-containing protein [Chlorobium sp.]|jgi:anti-anti-sigma factor|uniref:STAS domain-containing protein n=1 Tax=Chlorobium sp. TaxID=1095 RepID=UPI001D793594|nr:STAS domain-containing protein [Chlorobium sp.]MBN1278381.1 STAS domain-containing protein [Chlorobiaceae bacterium]MCF8216058.1 STAS domain-containing protein [Chlorobium sp.]MCF8270959.1 STAS domain-containing protein [Chlorobium sp.]MCF8287333.1 STAS domain-containing protein [Chlorobium sp.]MCF8291419.1 STAS domain-containing protein [Chlorobium sp.]